MTTRRSRLKAVANLPVRRKPAVFQENVDSGASIDNTSLTAAPQINETVDVKGSTNNDINPDGKQSDNTLFPKVTKTGIDSHCNENDKKKENDMINCSENDTNHNQSGILEKGDLSIVTNDKSDEHKDGNGVNNSENKNITIKYKKRAKPNLGVSRSKEQIKNNIQEANSTDVTPLLEGNNQSKTELALVAEDASTLPIDTASAPLISDISQGSIASVISLGTENIYEALQNGNVVETTNLITNLPHLISGNSNGTYEDVTDKEMSEPVLTTLVNCSTEDTCNFTNLGNYNGSDILLTSQTDTQRLSINETCTNAAVIEIINYPDNDGITRNIISPVRDKGLLDNLMYNEGQGVVIATGCNVQSITASKRNITSVKRKRSKCSEFTKKLADAKREFQKKYDKTKPDRSSLKMIDLIFYNPTTNPMESKNKSDKKEAPSHGGLPQDTMTDDDVDEPQEMDCDSNSQSYDSNGAHLRMPVPQVKIGLNGEIILDEKSVIIETTEAKKGREDLMKNSIPIFEDGGSRVSYYRGKTKKTRDWTDFETKRFYKALNTIGPDFSLMQKYFPKRSRMELKNKFKREERLNRSLIDKALINPSEFDMTQLEKDLAVERQAEEEELEMRMNKSIKEGKPPTKRSRTKSSLFSREMVQEIESNRSSENIIVRPVDPNDKDFFRDENEKKDKEIGQILRKYLLRDMKKENRDKSKITISGSSLNNTSNHGVT